MDLLLEWGSSAFFDVIREKIKDEYELKNIEKKICKFLNEYKIEFDEFSLDEEFDYAEVINCIKNNIKIEVSTYLYGKRCERENAKTQIIDKVQLAANTFSAPALNKVKLLCERLLEIIYNCVCTRVEKNNLLLKNMIVDEIVPKIQDLNDKIELNITSKTNSVYKTNNNNSYILVDTLKNLNEENFTALSSNICVCDLITFGNFDFVSMQCTGDKNVCNITSLNINEKIDMILQQKIIPIIGPYGTGKTFLSKYIQYNLIKNYKKNVLFFYTSDILNVISEPQITNDTFRLYMEIYSIDELFVFIDSFDILNNENADTNNIEKVLSNLVECTKIINIHFIINCRPFYNTDAANDMSDFFYIECKDVQDLLCYFETDIFNKEQLPQFFTNMKTLCNSNIDVLTKHKIEEWHKRASSSCSTPLFAFLLCNYYYRKKRLPEPSYDHYTEFISETISGKYKKESKHSISSMLNTEEAYRQFLIELSKDILKTHSKKIDYEDKYQYSNSDIVIQCNQERIFTIRLNQLSEKTTNIFKKINCNTALENIGNILNCFFFRVFSINQIQMVSFSDDNFLCCLAAEKASNLLNELSLYNNEAETKSICDNLIKELGEVSLHPMVIDYLISKTQNLDGQAKQIILANLIDMIRGFEINQSINSEIVKAQLIIHILFMKICNRSYQEINDLHFFKRLDRLCKIAKALNLNGKHSDDKDKHRYLIERYFSCCKFYECCFKRLNLKKFNFNNSDFKSVTFEQCRFDYNDKLQANLNMVRFTLCSISYTHFHLSLKGNIEFKNSIIRKLILDEVYLITCNNQNMNCQISFIGCTIEDMTVFQCKQMSIELKFSNCIINQLKFSSCKCKMNFTNCVFHSQVSIDNNSQIRINDDKNLLCFDSSSLYSISTNSKINSYQQEDEIIEYNIFKTPD